jgi:hypothetical protein
MATRTLVPSGSEPDVPSPLALYGVGCSLPVVPGPLHAINQKNKIKKMLVFISAVFGKYGTSQSFKVCKA